MSDHLKQVRKDFEESPFWSFLGMEIKELKEGHVELQLPYKESFSNVSNVMHGGVIASVLDTTMGVLTRSLGYDKVMTLQMNIHYLKAVSEGVVTTKGAIVDRGRSTSIFEARLYDEEGELVAFSTGTFRPTYNK